MTKARVVFADGSKALARNNEDLYERWRLRLESEIEHVERQPDSYVEQFAPPLATPQTMDEAQRQWVTLTEKIAILHREMALLKQDTEPGFGSRKRAAARRAPYVLALRELEIQVRRVKLWIGNHSENAVSAQETLWAAKLRMLDESREYWRERALAAESELAQLKGQEGAA